SAAACPHLSRSARLRSAERHGELKSFRPRSGCLPMPTVAERFAVGQDGIWLDGLLLPDLQRRAHRAHFETFLRSRPGLTPAPQTAELARSGRANQRPLPKAARPRLRRLSITIQMRHHSHTRDWAQL